MMYKPELERMHVNRCCVNSSQCPRALAVITLMKRRFRIVVKWALLGRKKRYLVWGVTRWSQVSVKP